MNYSDNQLNIFKHITDTNLNLLINATAGSGKTFTIVESSKLIPSYKKNLFLAFNKSIVENLKNRLPMGIECSTLHSIGMKSLMSNLKRGLKVNEFKSFMLCDHIVKEKKDLKESEKMIIKFNLMNLVNLIRITMSTPNESVIAELADKYDIYCINDEIKDSIRLFHELSHYNDQLGNKNFIIDFTDMIYLPVHFKLRTDQYDNIFIDEYQDLNRVQFKLIEMLVKPSGRTIYVGDSNQTIYGFNGADADGFEYIKNKPNTITLPLSISYRCSEEVVKKAKEVYDDIEYFSNNPKGEVRVGTPDEIELGDMVICRNTRPLIKLYFDLIKLDKKAKVVGKDIADGLLQLVTRFNYLPIDKYFAKLDDQLLTLIKELQKKGVKKPKNNIKYINLYEKHQTLRAIGELCETTLDLEQRVKHIFDETVDGIELMTIHRAKGLEADRVFLIERFEGTKLIPSKYATQDWQLLQEKNLLFVAITRAKNSLIYLNLN